MIVLTITLLIFLLVAAFMVTGWRRVAFFALGVVLIAIYAGYQLALITVGVR